MTVDYAAATAALRDAGLLVDQIEFDGTLHRCGTVDKPNSKNGWYVPFLDNFACITHGDWSTGHKGVWTSKSRSSMTKAEKEAFARRMKEAREARKTEQERVHAEAASKAQAIYTTATDCAEHPYLAAKGVKPVPGLKVSTSPKYDSLIVPVRNRQGELVGLQFIRPDGAKKFLAGTAKKGAFFPIGGKNEKQPLVLCEGLATGLSLHECTNLPVLVAFDAGNLLPVAEMARRLYPDRSIILAADYDDPTKKYPAPGGTGVGLATAAALAVDGSLAVPRHEGRKVDWNDLHAKMGPGEVRTQLMTHRRPEPPEPKNTPTELPAGFSLRSGGSLPGLWHTEIKDGDDPLETWIGAPLHVLGATRDEHGNSWGLLLEWHDLDGQRHTWSC